MHHFFSFTKGHTMRKGAELEIYLRQCCYVLLQQMGLVFNPSLHYWEIWEYGGNEICKMAINHVLQVRIYLKKRINRCELKIHCKCVQLMKAHPFSGHKIWLTLKWMSFFNSVIKVYWRPEWLRQRLSWLQVWKGHLIRLVTSELISELHFFDQRFTHY